MKNCRFARISKLLKWCAAFFYPAVSVLIFAACLTLAIFAIRYESDFALALELSVSAIGTVGAWLLLYFGLNSYKFESRKYAISQLGIELFPKNSQNNFTPWNDVTGICISAFNGTASLRRYQKVICIFISQESPEFWSKMVHGYNYAIRNYGNFIVIDYAEEVISALSSVYPGEITDYFAEQVRRYSI